MKLALSILVLVVAVFVGTAFCVSLHAAGTPEAGQEFTIQARDGVAPYTFKYRVGTEELVEIEQDEPTLKIDIPRGTTGDTLYVGVTDACDEKDAEIFFID